MKVRYYAGSSESFDGSNDGKRDIIKSTHYFDFSGSAIKIECYYDKVSGKLIEQINWNMVVDSQGNFKWEIANPLSTYTPGDCLQSNIGSEVVQVRIRRCKAYNIFQRLKNLLLKFGKRTH